MARFLLIPFISKSSEQPAVFEEPRVAASFKTAHLLGCKTDDVASITGINSDGCTFFLIVRFTVDSSVSEGALQTICAGYDSILASLTAQASVIACKVPLHYLPRAKLVELEPLR
jgi:hypothetical protein